MKNVNQYFKMHCCRLTRVWHLITFLTFKLFSDIILVPMKTSLSVDYDKPKSLIAPLSNTNATWGFIMEIVI